MPSQTCQTGRIKSSDLHDLCDLAHVVGGWKQYNPHDLRTCLLGWIYNTQILHNISSRQVRIQIIQNRDLFDLDRDVSDLDRDVSDLDRDLSDLDRDVSDLDRDLSDLSVRRLEYLQTGHIFLSFFLLQM